MKLITFTGLVGSLIGSLVFSLLTNIPAGIPFHIWMFSIFGAGIALLMVVEILIRIFSNPK
jgi:hypothetical protein